MQHKIKIFLFDIKTSIESILECFGESPFFEKHQNRKLLIRAVEREIEIIGEAVNNMIKNDSEWTNARRIVDTRNWGIYA